MSGAQRTGLQSPIHPPGQDLASATAVNKHWWRGSLRACIVTSLVNCQNHENAFLSIFHQHVLIGQLMDIGQTYNAGPGADGGFEDDLSPDGHRWRQH